MVVGRQRSERFSHACGTAAIGAAATTTVSGRFLPPEQSADRPQQFLSHSTSVLA
jgi:hypothetical protein